MRGAETLLVVDDDTGVLKVLKSILKRLGYTVWACADGEQAFTMFDAHPKDIQLLVSDVGVPHVRDAAASRAGSK